MTVLQQFKQTLSDHAMIEPGHSVLVALSGGPDSVALLHLLSRLRKTMKIRVSAIYINHQLRPRAARKEETFCQELCDGLSIPLIILREDIPAYAKTNKLGIEEAAREFRYATFERLIKENSLDRVALGHHADDQVETILFRLIRGSGPSGLTGIPAVRGRFIRPLINLTKTEILEYLNKQAISYCHDASNRSLKFSRNYIRNKLLPLIREKLNPQVDTALLSLADTIKAEDADLDARVDRASRQCLRISPGGKFRLALERYRGYAKWLRRRLVRRCLKATCRDGQFPSKLVVDRVDRLAFEANGSISLPGRAQATLSGKELLIFARPVRTVKVKLVPGKRVDLDWPDMKFVCRVVTRAKARPTRKKRSSRVWLDWDKLTLPLEVRSAKPGDRFVPLGMTGHKKVGDILTDCKVPRPLRDEVLVVCDQTGPIWLAGFEIAERVKIDDQTRKVLTVVFSIRKRAGSPAV